MSFEAESWRILGDAEYHCVWDKVDEMFQFSPSIDSTVKPFNFKIPVDIYDITASSIWHDDNAINEQIRCALVECIKNDDYMYALDWQHTCFRYNPRIIDRLDYPIFIKYDTPIKNEHVNWEGYNVYFPTFYPNGDYYFFIAKDFSWGYLTHPWLKRVYIYGDCIRKCFSRFADEIGFILCAK